MLLAGGPNAAWTTVGPCNCYGSVASPLDGKGCGQLNAFEVVNDNNDYQTSSAHGARRTRPASVNCLRARLMERSKPALRAVI
jgi:hypothetical protein